MTQPLVSFVVPVYNAEKTIERCVWSLQKQTMSDLEILLIDDGSKDRSFEVCKSLADEDARIRVIHQENAGVSVARNVGIENALGRYISFVDADDWIDANTCEVFATALQKHDYDLYCFSAVYRKNGKEKRSFLFANDRDLLTEKQLEELHLKVMTPWAPGFEHSTNTRYAASSWGKFYKKSIIGSFRFVSGLIVSEDGLFNLFVLNNVSTAGFTIKCNYRYEQHDDSAQFNYRPNSTIYFEKVAVEAQSLLISKNQKFRQSANTWYVHFLFGILREDIFHKKNEKKFCQKRKEILQIMQKDVYAKALKNIDWNYFSFAEKILVIFLKLKMIRIIALAMKIIA